MTVAGVINIPCDRHKSEAQHRRQGQTNAGSPGKGLCSPAVWVSAQPHLCSGPCSAPGLPFPALLWGQYGCPAWEGKLTSHIRGLILSTSSEKGCKGHQRAGALGTEVAQA